VDGVKAKVMYAAQQPLSASALGEVMGVPAWKGLPSWYMVAEGDQAIPPAGSSPTSASRTPTGYARKIRLSLSLVDEPA
jgi:hypothetical protein